MNIAIIPARGGSKRIPRKNIKLFNGKPMLVWSLMAAKDCGLFDEIIVSTDDDQIALVAESFGARVPFIRPAHLSDDLASMTDVVKHAVEWMNTHENAPTAVCCIHAVAPFITALDLCQGHTLLAGHEYVFAATSFEYPIHRAFGADLQMLFPDRYMSRSQDLPQVWHDAGQFYWGTPEAWLSSAQIFTPRSAMVEIPRWRAQDIDTPEDWECAQRMAA